MFAAGAAIGAGEHGVGEGTVHLDVAGRERIGAGQHADQFHTNLVACTICGGNGILIVGCNGTVKRCEVQP